ncbi:hypothetical protein BBP40_004116 [Aspergillus hancockii]|nr:hypothetical protein BBP40_004116 [Aspergillus hancockii]
MHTLTIEEMERFRELSNKIEPDIQRRVVSAEHWDSAISMEYASAGPVFATKPSVRAVPHPFPRIIRGDGKCGWLAVVFGYFENLFNLRDMFQLHRELIRIKSINVLLDRVGVQKDLYKVFVDVTERIFTRISEAVQSGILDKSFLIDTFNNQYNSNAIIAYFRLLTSAWIKLNPRRYQAFLSLPVDQYCETRIEAANTELDEVGLRALIDGVIGASGVAIHNLHLDRSGNDAFTTHLVTLAPPRSATYDLAYCRGQYDLYGAEPTTNIDLVASYQYAMPSDYSSWDQAAFSFEVNPNLMRIPNLVMDSSFATAPPPMPATPPSAFQDHSPQNVYQPPMHTPPQDFAPIRWAPNGYHK